MRKIRRIISFLLAMAMVLEMLPAVVVRAEEKQPAADYSSCLVLLSRD